MSRQVPAPPLVPLLELGLVPVRAPAPAPVLHLLPLRLLVARRTLPWQMPRLQWQQQRSPSEVWPVH